MAVNEAWVELKTDDGRTYFWNRRENSRAWVLPQGTTVKWVGQKSPDGRTYYWSRENKETVWVLPPLPESSPKPSAAEADSGAPKQGAAADAVQGAAAEAVEGEEETPSTAPVLAVATQGGLGADAPVKGAEMAVVSSDAVEPHAATVEEVAAASEPEAPLLCHLPCIEPPGPRGDSASAVAARHVIEKSGCDVWFHQLPNGDWEEVLRFWPPPEELNWGRAPKLKKPKPDPYGIRELVMRCQRHEEMVRALLVAQHGTASTFSAATFPCPRASDWCFWTSESKQIVVDANAPPILEETSEGEEKSKHPVVQRCPPEGARWRLLRSGLRDQFSMVFKATRLRSLEKAIRKGDKAEVQSLLEQLMNRAPERLARAAQMLLAPPPPPKPPPPQADGPATTVAPAQPLSIGGLGPLASCPVPPPLSTTPLGLVQTMPGMGPPLAVPSKPAPTLAPVPGAFPPGVTAAAPLAPGLVGGPCAGADDVPKPSPPALPDASRPVPGTGPELMRKQPPHSGPPAGVVEAWAKSSSLSGDPFAKGKSPAIGAGASDVLGQAPKLPSVQVTAGPFAKALPPAPDGAAGAAGAVHKAAPAAAPEQSTEAFAKVLPPRPPGVAGVPAQLESGLLAPGAVGGGSGQGPPRDGQGRAAVRPQEAFMDAYQGCPTPATGPPTKAPPSATMPQWKACPGAAAASGPTQTRLPTKAPPTPAATELASGAKAPPPENTAPSASTATVAAGLLAQQGSSPTAGCGDWAGMQPPPTPQPRSGFTTVPGSQSTGGGAPHSLEASVNAQVPSAEAPWKKRRRGRASTGEASTAAPAAGATEAVAEEPRRTVADRAATEKIVASAERLAAATGGSTPLARGEPNSAEGASDVLKRKVVVSNIPLSAKLTDLADFFTGAIFSATGHTLAAQWQSGEASKVVVGVELAGGSVSGPNRAAEVTFGTGLGAAVCLALNGIQFQGKALGIKRPKGYSGPQQRPRLQSVSIKDLIASDPADARDDASKGAGGAEGAIRSSGTGASVKLSGIPSSMGSKSVFDLLQQFGGPLQSLNLSINKDTGEHVGKGTAEYVDRSSAVEAVRFSPLLGFIEVQHTQVSEATLDGSTQTAMTPATETPPAKRQRRSRFDCDATDDLGPFEAALQQREQAQKVPSSTDEAVDLGPFEAVLPPKRSGEPETPVGLPLESDRTAAESTGSGLEDLGPFEAVLPPVSFDAEDLGPFAAAVQGLTEKAS